MNNQLLICPKSRRSLACFFQEEAAVADRRTNWSFFFSISRQTAPAFYTSELVIPDGDISGFTSAVERLLESARRERPTHVSLGLFLTAPLLYVWEGAPLRLRGSNELIISKSSALHAFLHYRPFSVATLSTKATQRPQVAGTCVYR